MATDRPSNAEEIREYYRRSGLSVRVNGKTPAEMTDRELLRWWARASANGEEMLRLGKAPRVISDDTFFRGFTKTGGEQFTTDLTREFYLEEAKKAGVSVAGKQYFGELAAYPGDPRAWVGSRGEMVKLLEERNWGSDGDIKVKCEAVEPAKDTKLADDIVDDMIADRLEDAGRETITRGEYEEMKSEIVDTHGPSY